MKYYKISIEDLKNLLFDSATLKILECDGVDNWPYYMEGREQYIADMLDTSIDKVQEQDLQLSDVVNEWIKDYEIIKED